MNRIQKELLLAGFDFEYIEISNVCHLFHNKGRYIILKSLKDNIPDGIIERTGYLPLHGKGICNLSFIEKMETNYITDLKLGGNPLISKPLSLRRLARENFQKLERLSLRDLNLNSLGNLNNLGIISHIELGNNKFDETSLKDVNLGKIRSLDLYSNRIKSLKFLLENNINKDIEYIGLSGNKIIDFEPLLEFEFPKLRMISLDYNPGSVLDKNSKIIKGFKNICPNTKIFIGFTK